LNYDASMDSVANSNQANEPARLPPVSVEHIAIDAHGNAYVADPGIQVKHLVGLKEAQGYTAEQLQAEAYPHLTLAQIYDALAYYHDHRAEIDRQIEKDDELYEHQRRRQQDDPAHQRFVAALRSRRQKPDVSAR